jgi:hypothetical protein
MEHPLMYRTATPECVPAGNRNYQNSCDGYYYRLGGGTPQTLGKVVGYSGRFTGAKVSRYV